MNIKTNQLTYNLTKHKISIIILIVILIIDLTFTGFLKFGYNVVRCGGVPVAVTTTPFWGGNASYWLPGNYSIRTGNKYFCTEKEAKDANYQRSSLQ